MSDKLDVTFDWDAILIGFTGGLEPNTAANLLRSNGNLHMWYPNQAKPATAWEAEIDQLLDQGSREIDPLKRQPKYWRIQEILHEELPPLMLVQQKRFRAYKNTLENFSPTIWGIYHPERIRFRAITSALTSSRHDMAGFLVHRLLQMIPLVLGITLISFIVIEMAPGTTFTQLRQNPSVSKEAVAKMEREFGYGARCRNVACAGSGAPYTSTWAYRSRTASR